MAQNKAAWLMQPKQNPFTIAEAQMPQPSPHEVVIRTAAVAINPVDWAMQAMDMGLIPSYPWIIGCDVAGQVTAVGSNVTRFKCGDRVTALTDAYTTKKQSNNSFQLFCATNQSLVAKVPDGVSYAQASVLPLAISTAAVALFSRTTLGLSLPQPNSKVNNKMLLVWGGSSSVGSCAIQLAIGAGYAVAATAGANNVQYCKDLGAKFVFDHCSENIVEDIVSTLKGTNFVGAFDAVLAPETLLKCGQIVSKLDGAKHVGTVLPPGMPLPEGLSRDVEFSYTSSLDLADGEVGLAVWGEWISGALANGSLQCKPEPYIVGKGLESIQIACDRMGAGVSASKIVVEIE